MNHIYEFNLFKKKIEPNKFKQANIEDIEDRLQIFKDQGVEFNVGYYTGDKIMIEVRCVDPLKPMDLDGGLKRLYDQAKDKMNSIVDPIIKKLNLLGYEIEYKSDRINRLNGKFSNSIYIL